LAATATAGGGQSFNASDEASLTNSLKAVLNSISSTTATNVPVVASKPTNPSEAIQATFYSGDWSGQLRAYNVSSTTGLANLNSTIPGAVQLIQYHPAGQYIHQYRGQCQWCAVH
jgi:type IV pilus assembly protein PilY1